MRAAKSNIKFCLKRVDDTKHQKEQATAYNKEDKVKYFVSTFLGKVAPPNKPVITSFFMFKLPSKKRLFAYSMYSQKSRSRRPTDRPLRNNNEMRASASEFHYVAGIFSYFFIRIHQGYSMLCEQFGGKVNRIFQLPPLLLSLSLEKWIWE